jgi:hypothetical protein
VARKMPTRIKRRAKRENKAVLFSRKKNRPFFSNDPGSDKPDPPKN